MYTCQGCIQEMGKAQGVNNSGETLGSMLRNIKETPLQKRVYITEKGTVISRFYCK